MSTVCCDGTGIAADGRMTFYDRIISADVPKVIRLDDGSIIGAAGNPAHLPKVAAWLNGGRKTEWPVIPKDGDDGFIGLHLTVDGLFMIDKDGGFTRPNMPVAVGSGAGIAVGALEAGASVRQAIEIACKHDVWTGGTIMVEYLNDDAKTAP